MSVFSSKTFKTLIEGDKAKINWAVNEWPERDSRDGPIFLCDMTFTPQMKVDQINGASFIRICDKVNIFCSGAGLWRYFSWTIELFDFMSLNLLKNKSKMYASVTKAANIIANHEWGNEKYKSMQQMTRIRVKYQNLSMFPSMQLKSIFLSRCLFLPQFEIETFS